MKPALSDAVLVFLALSLLGADSCWAAPAHPDYAVVVSQATRSDPGWRGVVETLQKKHGATVIVYGTSLDETLSGLRQQFPRYACFVAQPSEVTRSFVASVSQLTCRLDDDPYPDCFWGILTGYDAAAALRVAKEVKPLTVRKVAAGTEVALEMCEEGQWYCELNRGKTVRKTKGGAPQEFHGPDDTTGALVKALTEYKADLFVTSGHATERDWQIGYRYRNGQFRCRDGLLYGVDTQGRELPVESPNPKVYLPVGNCLMGHIDRPDCMALAWMRSAGVCQMFGYTEPTWYGYMGWGILDYFVEQPGRFTLTEAFFANQAALIHRLQTYFPDSARVTPGEKGRGGIRVEVNARARDAGLSANDERGLLFDRDVVAFYGDPAWQARLAKGPCAWDQALTHKAGRYVFEIRPKRGASSFEPVNRNGSQRGGRPFVHFFAERLGDIQILQGAELEPVITDDFILVPNPGRCDPSRSYRVEFAAHPIR
jgi:hypothetical protein